MMTDMHCHILPGVDDGSSCLSESLRMAELALRGGTRAIIATPHLNITAQPLEKRRAQVVNGVAELHRELERRGIKLEIFPGVEIMASGAYGFSAVKIERSLVTLAGSRYCLVEYDANETGEAMLASIRTVVSAGLVPVIAHAERYLYFQGSGGAATKVKAAGALIQINKGSVLGRGSDAEYHAAWSLLYRREADFAASDSHSPYERTPYLYDLREVISEKCSERYAGYLLTENPAKIIKNKPIYASYTLYKAAAQLSAR